MLMPETVKLAELPAKSVAVPVTDCAEPSPSVVGPEMFSNPESASLPLKLTTTSALYQLSAFAARSEDPEMFGAVLSMLTLETVALAELPARSVTVNVCDCPVPSAVNEKDPVAGELRPDNASDAT